MDLLTILVKGGYLMIPIGIASLIGVAIIIYKIGALKKLQTPKDMLIRLEEKIRANDREGIAQLCKIYECPASRVILAGLESKESMYATIGKEVTFAEMYLTGLATIAGISPLLGFLGTVTGMIRAFMEVQALGGNVNASVLAGGIWEALVTTAAGLSVAIVMYIFYNYFVGKIKSFTQELNAIASKIQAMK